MSNQHEFTLRIKVNGIWHNSTPLENNARHGAKIFLDSEELPFTRCSCHNLISEAVKNLKAGYSVKTNGNTYSLR